VLTVGSDVPFPPFEFREGSELTGFDVDLMEEIARRLGLDEVRWVDTSFDTIFTQLAGGRFDAVASATTITEERSQIVAFSDPYYLAQQALTVNTAETPDIDSVETLSSGDVVAVQQGTTGEIWARDNVPEGVDIRSFPEAPDTYTALEAGNVTAVIFDEPSALAEAERRADLEVVQTLDTGERYGFPVNPQNEELLGAINAALGEMIADGTYAEIYSAYPDLPPGGNVAEGT
jgi:polar amino acid transport system substrate-binding protein